MSKISVSAGKKFGGRARYMKGQHLLLSFKLRFEEPVTSALLMSYAAHFLIRMTPRLELMFLYISQTIVSEVAKFAGN